MGNNLASFKREVNHTWDFVKTKDDQTTTQDQDKLLASRPYTDGDGNNQANELWHDRRSVSPSTTTDLLDLHGTLLNAFGETADFKSIKEIVIVNLGVVSVAGVESASAVFTPTDGEDLLIGGASSNPWTSWINGSATGKVRIRSGGPFTLGAPMDGYGVGAGDGDILQVAWDGSVASGGDIGYSISVLGVKW